MSPNTTGHQAGEGYADWLVGIWAQQQHAIETHRLAVAEAIAARLRRLTDALDWGLVLCSGEPVSHTGDEPHSPHPHISYHVRLPDGALTVKDYGAAGRHGPSLEWGSGSVRGAVVGLSPEGVVSGTVFGPNGEVIAAYVEGMPVDPGMIRGLADRLIELAGTN